MRQFLMTLLMSIASAAATNFVMQPESAPRESPAVPESIEERVVQLPEDGHQWHTILILRPEWKNLRDERQAEALFHSEPWLMSLKAQTHWHLMTTDQAEFVKFRSLVSATPCLVIERANGEVVYRESGPDLGRRAHGLRHAIRREIERHCPDGRCLPLHPVPGPNDPPEKDAVPTILREEQPGAPRRHTPLWTGLCLIAAGTAGIAWQWKKNG